MLDRFTMDFIDAQSTEFKEYCRMENVMISALAQIVKPKHTIKRRMQAFVCHVLQRMNNRLDIVISRLTADMERSGRVQRHLS